MYVIVSLETRAFLALEESLIDAVTAAAKNGPAEVLSVATDKHAKNKGAPERIVAFENGAFTWHSDGARHECTRRGIPGVE